jgi:two-component sensor histidine kinase
MAIHELATNAIKYGALSNPSGRAKIFWCVDDAPETALRLTWTEEGGPPIEGAPARDGFGTRLLMGTITQQLGGKVSKTWPSSGLVCTIEVPLRSPSLTAQTTMAAALGG